MPKIVQAIVRALGCLPELNGKILAEERTQRNQPRTELEAPPCKRVFVEPRRAVQAEKQQWSHLLWTLCVSHFLHHCDQSP